MYPCPGNWAAFGSAVVYYSRDVHTFSAGIKCRYCIHKYSLQYRETTIQSIDCKVFRNRFINITNAFLSLLLNLHLSLNRILLLERDWV